MEKLTLALDLNAHTGTFGEIRIYVIKADLVQLCPAPIMAQSTNKPLTLASGTSTLSSQSPTPCILKTPAPLPVGSEQQVPEEVHPVSTVTVSPVPSALAWTSTSSSPAISEKPAQVPPATSDQQVPPQKE